MVKSESDQNTCEKKILESVDDIEIPEDNNISPINFDGLPEYNITKQFVNYVSNVSDTYREYSFTNNREKKAVKGLLRASFQHESLPLTGQVSPGFLKLRQLPRLRKARMCRSMSSIRPGSTLT